MENYPTHPIFQHYPVDGPMLDEVIGTDGDVIAPYKPFLQETAKLNKMEIKALYDYARSSFFNQGITFNVYDDTAQGEERIFPFDLVPRILTAEEWHLIEKGLVQRNTAINLFLKDIYHNKQILKDKVVPADLLFSCPFYLKQMMDVNPVGDIYVHVSGTDIIRHSDGHFYVLEDNVRCPSGVSYVLSNRMTMKRLLPGAMMQYHIEPVQQYPEELYQVMLSVAPPGVDHPNCVVLTPGMYNSAYYEHSFLAQAMGIPLVEGRDLFVENNYVYMKTIYGPKRVDVIYRRIDDDFMDPLVFRPYSLLGVPGLMAAYREGNVSVLNAPGTGAADDKAVYVYMPEIIRYYLQEEPLLKNVPTYRCELEGDYQYVIENLDNLVVKPVDASGGYGIMIGPKSTRDEKEACRKKMADNRRKYIAQPVMNLSVHPTFIEGEDLFEPRHIDLRTFSLFGKNKTYVCKGGLTRVALRRGNLVVNSSQGGGSKDTWVLGNPKTH